MTFDPSFVSNLILILTGFGGAFLAALWISLVIWTYRDIRTRARDPLVQILATLLVAVAFGLSSRNTSARSKRRHCSRPWRICRSVPAVSAASRMTGRSVRTATPS